MYPVITWFYTINISVFISKYHSGEKKYADKIQFSNLISQTAK